MSPGQLGLGVVGAGRFAGFLVDAVRDLPDVAVAVVTDADPVAAERLAGRHGARVVSDWPRLVHDPAVDAVVVATPPDSHATIATGALQAGRHVFCEKPLALSADDARTLEELVEATGLVLVVDHVLRYNPLLAALLRLRDELLGEPQRFCFENDASDEDLGPGHWFWRREVSGGIFLEHGVHFFDAAAMLLSEPPTAVQACTATRSGSGLVDLVSATVRHGDTALATHTHSFTHAHRCERQLMRLDHGAAETRVVGWIPVEAAVDVWTDDAGAKVCEDLPGRAEQLLGVEGYRLGPKAAVTAEVSRDAGHGFVRSRGRTLNVPHHGRIRLTLGGPPAKQEVYRESVRAAMADLVGCVRNGRRPRSGAREGAAAVRVAAAATAAADDGRSHDISHDISHGGRR